MKEGIHPKYEDAVITCACGEVIHTRHKEGSAWMCAPSAIPFTPANRSWWIPADALTALKSVSALRTKAKLNRKKRPERATLSQAFLFL